MKANDLSNFRFTFLSYGHYRVSYITGRGDFYVALVTDMISIDRTKNAEWAKLKDIRSLASLCKRIGVHYHADGSVF